MTTTGVAPGNDALLANDCEFAKAVLVPQSTAVYGGDIGIVAGRRVAAERTSMRGNAEANDAAALAVYL